MMDEKLNILRLFTIGMPYKWDYTHILTAEDVSEINIK
jgi:hypothetical protein